MSLRKQAAREVNGGAGQPTRSEKAKLSLNARELDAVRKWCNTPKTPKVKISGGERGIRLEPDHPTPGVGVALLLEALGTTDPDFLYGLLGELVALTSSDGEIDQRQFDFALSIARGIKPQDQTESLAAVHIAARRLPDRESSQQTFNKSTRTLVAVMESLKRYRSGGQQTVTVQHVHVSEGGQAIVGHVTQAQTKKSCGS